MTRQELHNVEETNSKFQKQKRLKGDERKGE